MKRFLAPVLLAALVWTQPARAQQYEALSDSVRSAMVAAIDGTDGMDAGFASAQEQQNWISRMSPRISRQVPDPFTRVRLLKSIHYEAARAGLDPLLVLGLITVESGFQKYAVSGALARGYMQVMPFWTRLLGRPSDDLFDTHTNLRYGCTILRHYIDIEHGNLYRALGRYNGSLGHPAYPGMVLTAWKRYQRLTTHP